ncbi:zinc finger domain-containing protein [Cellulomonas telluris]|uniref:zinc finger domain-containing protein n=1 Tax=Cellulomonas telluris TaxID=2306636 RepID=UPI003F95313D
MADQQDGRPARATRRRLGEHGGMTHAEEVHCPRCGAEPGRTCRTSDRVPRPPHKRRRQEAERRGEAAAAGS